MIKASELRIGNWVSTKNGNGKIRTIDPNGENYSGIVSNNDESVWERVLHDNGIIPIPITGELLSKWGFAKYGKTDCFIYSGSAISIQINKELSINLIDNEDNEIILPPIKYVHQLQNLYFALTGEDLRIDL